MAGTASGTDLADDCQNDVLGCHARSKIAVNRDPHVLQRSLQERLGSPEGELAIAQAVVYLACAAKSNAVYDAFSAATAEARQSGSVEVPLHLRSAPTALLKDEGYGEGYRYAHDEPGGFAAGVRYFPDGMSPVQFYQPTDRGLERAIKEKLERLRELNEQAERGEGS